ncbi:MAG: flagellar export protein FliJ [Desulfobacterales bacterium]|nr:flagellar export protein FliJ [Desulfobacterales bacterium]
MKKFQFKLEPYLKYKEFLEDRAKMEVGKAVANVLNCENETEAIKNNINAASLAFDKETSLGINAERMYVYTNYINGLESSLESKQKELRQLILILEQKQKELAKKSVEKKTIDNLKDKRKEEYYQNIFKLLQKENDDTIIIREASAHNHN